MYVLKEQRSIWLLDMRWFTSQYGSTTRLKSQNAGLRVQSELMMPSVACESTQLSDDPTFVLERP